MKIMMIVADGHPGGGTTNVLALAHDLIESGNHVTVCSQQDSYAIAEAKRVGADVCNGLNFFRSRIDRRLVLDLRTSVDRVAPDVVHVHGGRAGFNWVCGADKEQLNRTIYTVRGYQFWRKKQPNKFLAKLAERRISRLVYRTVYVSYSDQKVGLEQGFVRNIESTQVIRNGIHAQEIPMQTPWNNEGRLKEVAVLGRITEPKNPHLVLDIAKSLASEGYVFHMIGGGDLEAVLRERINREQIGNVVMHGPQSRENGLRLMSKCGTFLLASIWEGLPLSPVEAMALGLAIVITDVNGCTEVVRDGIDGRVVPSENLGAFVNALRAVVAEPTQTSRMIASARQWVASEFTSERVLLQHLELYRQCLSQVR